MHIFFENPFLTTWQIAKHLFSHPIHTICAFFKIPKKHYEIGENKQKILDQVLTHPWTKFDSKKPKSWTKFWLYSIYIYIYYLCLFLFSLFSFFIFLLGLLCFSSYFVFLLLFFFLPFLSFFSFSLSLSSSSASLTWKHKKRETEKKEENARKERK